MAKTKISEFSATPANNTDIDSINIAEGCAPSGINDAIRELMAQLKDFQTGAVGDSFNGPIGTTTAAAGAFTTLSSTGNTTLGDASGDAVTINGTATFANANPTLTAGTANGVTYLNGSKVLTSGSALTFDGTSVTYAAGVLNYTGTSVPSGGNNQTLFSAVYNIGLAGTFASLNFTTTSASPTTSAWWMLGRSNGADDQFSLRVRRGGTSATDQDAYKVVTSGADSVKLVDNHQWYTNSTERARIDSSGNLLVGVTSGTYHTMYKDHADWALMARNGNANPYGVAIRYSGAAPNGSVNFFLEMYDTSVTRARFASNGGLANYSANNSNLSDRREKTNFAPAKSYLDVICAIPVQTFNYIDQNLEEDDGLTLGVVAQDVQAVAPELVMESNWAKEGDDPKMRLSIYQTDLQYALMKCIQEQQAIIESLKARLDAANL